MFNIGREMKRFFACIFFAFTIANVANAEQWCGHITPLPDGDISGVACTWKSGNPPFINGGNRIPFYGCITYETGRLDFAVPELYGCTTVTFKGCVMDQYAVNSGTECAWCPGGSSNKDVSDGHTKDYCDCSDPYEYFVGGECVPCPNGGLRADGVNGCLCGHENEYLMWFPQFISRTLVATCMCDKGYYRTDDGRCAPCPMGGFRLPEGMMAGFKNETIEYCFLASPNYDPIPVEYNDGTGTFIVPTDTELLFDEEYAGTAYCTLDDRAPTYAGQELSCAPQYIQFDGAGFDEKDNPDSGFCYYTK